MSTRDTVQEYYKCLKQKKGWETFFTEDVVFTSFTSPVKQVKGKGAFLKSSQGFYSSIVSMEVRDLIIDGEKVCGLTHYELQPPKGPVFGSDVAEIFTLKNGKFDSFAIYFDNTPFPK